MEMAYLDKNARELELTKHVSVRLLDPDALLTLRLTGRCEIELPEWLFHMNGPWYFARIRNVALSLPCVVGPYTSVNCKLTMLRSRIRTTPTLHNNQYAWQGDDDPRFTEYFGSQDTIVTSTAVNDAGLFEVNERDERYWPFEGRGAWSTWRLELPALQQFNYDTISDVILHLRYTARDGGSVLGEKITAGLVKAVNDAAALGSTRLFSLRHEFPSAWAKLRATPAGQSGVLTFKLTEDHYPYWRRVLTAPMKTYGARVIARSPAQTLTLTDAAGRSFPLAPAQAGIFDGSLDPASLAPLGDATLEFDDVSLTDLWLLLKWGT
jgi:hypothetical protein